MGEKDIDALVFEEEDHSVQLVEQLHCMYREQLLTDVTICVEEAELPCHRNVLAAVSPYFRAMFTSSMSESCQDRVRLFDVDADSVDAIINFAYTGQIKISKNNAQNLLSSASLFQIQPVLQACARYMETQLELCNCIGIYYFANLHNCQQLKCKAKEFIDKFFVEVVSGEEFLALPPDKVADLMTSNELNVECEEEVFEALLQWVSHKKEERKGYLSSLLVNIRFGLISVRYIENNIACNELIRNCEVCQQLLKEVKEFEANPETYKGEYNFNVILRSGMIKPEHCILLVGGVDQNKPSINCFNPLTRESYYMCDIGNSEKQGYLDIEDPACVVTDKNEIFMAGGNYLCREHLGESPSEDSFEEYDDDIISKSLYQFDNQHDCWVPKAPMLFPKSNFVLAAVDNKLFCFGGLTINQHPTEIIECYDIKLNKWSYVGMMPTPLVDLSAMVYKGMMYILGGRTGVGAHNIMMRFEHKKNEWTSLAGMPTPRFNFGSCVVGDEIYVAGGQIYSHSSHTISRESLSSVEIYSVEKNQWRQGPNLPEEMYNVGLFVINGSLYVCGTTEYRRQLYRMYRYNVVYKLNIARGSWTQVESDLCNIRDYICVAAKMHTRKLSQVFRPEVDT